MWDVHHLAAAAVSRARFEMWDVQQSLNDETANCLSAKSSGSISTRTRMYGTRLYAKLSCASNSLHSR